jgi:DNA-binding transcriptional ArsR family regulator
MRRDVFQAIADPTRRAIIGVLAEKKATVSEVATHFEVSLVAISKQIKILEECGLVQTEQVGRERYCIATLEKLAEVAVWVTTYELFWKKRLTNLKNLLDNKKRKKD